MATTNYSIALPVVGGSTDTWGSEANAAFEAVDGELFRVEGLVNGKLNLAGGTLTGALNGTTATFSSFVGPLTGNAQTASRWLTARTITLSGPVTGSVSVDGSANGTLNTAIADGALSIAKTSGLQAALDGKQATGDYVTHASGSGRLITVSATQPTSPSVGDIWFDTSS